MIDVGIHVGVEAILVGRGHTPAVGWLLFGEADSHNRLRALESVFPRHHNPQRRAILIGKLLAVHPEAKQCQRIHGFIHTQPLDIGPIQHLSP